MFDVTGKVAVVTGGATGIGFAIASALAANGARVAVWGVDAAQNVEARRRFGELNGDVIVLECDVAREDDVTSAMGRTLDRYGRVDAGFAVAGVDSVSSILEVTTEEWHRVLSVNLDGTFFTLRALARHMVERGHGGSLVGTTSLAAIRGRSARESYSASKAGVLGLILSLAAELGPHGIRVNALMPGAIETAMSLGGGDATEIASRLSRRIPLQRMGRPDELAPIAVYLTSDASSYHSGDMIPIDGGYGAV
jgi:NAD(P)-dependent dehydrogenase (short-subunit alcohol dehydrogenase family)